MEFTVTLSSGDTQTYSGAAHCEINDTNGVLTITDGDSKVRLRFSPRAWQSIEDKTGGYDLRESVR